MTLRVLVTASRTWRDVDRIDLALARVWHEFGCPPDPVLVSGRARGGDRICEMCWRRRGFEVEEHEAIWSEHAGDCPGWHAGLPTCRKAGFRRDAKMVGRGATVCLAFIDLCVDGRCKRPEPHGSHGATGTAAMAERAGIDTRRKTSGF